MKKTLLLLALISSGSYVKANLITNGGFESGLAGWTVTNQVGSLAGSSWFAQTGTSSPLSGFAVPAPPQGLIAAMTDQGGGGSHALVQSFVVPGGITSVQISFLLFIGNRLPDGRFFTPNSLDLNVIPNQQARVDILTAAATPFDLTPSNIVANLYQTHVGDAPISGYSLRSSIVNGLTPGATYQLRFAEVDNQMQFQMGVDSVVIDTVPEPATFGLVGFTIIALVISGLRARAQRWLP
jgi:hypothetical protein